jgi:hypothetical protein
MLTNMPHFLWTHHHPGENHAGSLFLSKVHADVEDQPSAPPPTFLFRPNLIAIDHHA